MMPEITPQRLAEIRGRLEAAPCGPWFVAPPNEADLEYTEIRVCQESPPRHVIARCCVSTDQAAWLIAHAPADLRALLGDHARQAAEIERLRKQVEAYKRNERQRWGNAREVFGLDKEDES